MKLVIGLVGENGSGKGTFAESLMQEAKKEGFTCDRIRSSDILRETLTLWDIPFTRENFQKLALLMVTVYGEGTLTDAVKARIEGSKKNIVIFDGVRWRSDEKLIRSFKKHLIVYVTAKPKVRYERMRARKEKTGEGIMTFEQFLEEEVAPTEKDIPVIGKAAHITFENSGPIGVLEKEVKEAFKNTILPLVVQ